MNWGGWLGHASLGPTEALGNWGLGCMSWEAPRFSRKGVKQKILSDFLEWDTTERIAEKTK